jgi:hypothetical protein
MFDEFDRANRRVEAAKSWRSWFLGISLGLSLGSIVAQNTTLTIFAWVVFAVAIVTWIILGRLEKKLHEVFYRMIGLDSANDGQDSMAV